MRKKILLLFYGLFIIGCNSLQPSNPPDPTSIDNWGIRWMEGIPCKAPCWENITPDVTTDKEAVLLLMDSPVHLIHYLPLGDSISFEWKDKDNIYYSGDITLDSQGIVKSISLRGLYENVGFKFENIFTFWGEPQISFTGRCAPIALYTLDVYYPEYGTLFNIFESESPINLSQNSIFYSVHFFEEFNASYQIWDDWQGYSKDYKIRKTLSTFQSDIQNSFDSSVCSVPSS